MPTDRRVEIDEIEKALNAIAEWLIACYGPRVTAISLTLEGYYSPAPEYYGIYPWISRAEGETREDAVVQRGAGPRRDGLPPPPPAGSDRTRLVAGRSRYRVLGARRSQGRDRAPPDRAVSAFRAPGRRDQSPGGRPMRRSSDKPADGAKSSRMSLAARIAELAGIIEGLSSGHPDVEDRIVEVTVRRIDAAISASMEARDATIHQAEKACIDVKKQRSRQIRFAKKRLQD